MAELNIKEKATWLDKIHEVYVLGLKRTKEILHDESVPWKEREDRAIEALKEIKKMMVECRPPELKEEIASHVASDVVSNAEHKVEAYCEQKGKEDAVAKVGTEDGG